MSNSPPKDLVTRMKIRLPQNAPKWFQVQDACPSKGYRLEQTPNRKKSCFRKCPVPGILCHVRAPGNLQNFIITFPIKKVAH
ncbi:hypothetical protein PanWU01x14_096280 [Parasponia andersonii]|uniref:Uncharacterized protein n=1 Tax=Parasponia andersonii TaxID=3476 RepID=A0A2P5D507_PARAD|nr:hypothetical protein PanWU01x14_096280 [Parasponia andersonii]